MLQPVLAQQAQPIAHQPVVVGLVARGARELADARALGEGDPELGDQDTFQIEADDLHAGSKSRTKSWLALRL